MTAPAFPTIVVVTGHGLMRAVDGDAKWVAVVGHGPPKATGHWFPRARVRVLTEDEARQALNTEREQARDVHCTNPDCWCVRFLY